MARDLGQRSHLADEDLRSGMECRGMHPPGWRREKMTHGPAPTGSSGSAQVPLGTLAFASLLEASAVPPLPSRAVTSCATRSLSECCLLGAPGPMRGLLSPFTFRSAVGPGVQALTHVPGATTSCFPPCAPPPSPGTSLHHLFRPGPGTVGKWFLPLPAC